MERYLCIHGHFYQPPRENPWLEAIEVQDGAYPYHDWNERITAECYAPNALSRMLDDDERIRNIISNYARISFDMGPTLLSWMQAHAPSTYELIIEADKVSAKWHGGHGSAMAQCYNHLIMPLASKADKITQSIWGIKDFRHRFGRNPEGIWLPETAVDMETLSILSSEGIKFTVLDQNQAKRVVTADGREIDVSGGKIDPKRPYTCTLDGGKSISIFFYDGSISQAVAFEGLLKSGDQFRARLMSGYDEHKDGSQLMNIATDGESYGHHHRFGDMAMSYALTSIEENNLARLTNYGEYLELQPPTDEVQIVENTSWSCAHGVERWRSDCGCSTGFHPHWNQQWRKHLRDSLDWLRDEVSPRYQQEAAKFFHDPQAARNDYISVILNHENLAEFLTKHSNRDTEFENMPDAIGLLELQRNAMLMYTSCGWFFDDISGIETVQILRYAGRVLQFARSTLKINLEPQFLNLLTQAQSNVPAHGTGKNIFDSLVSPYAADHEKVAAHYAITSIFEDYAEEASIYCYNIQQVHYSKSQAAKAEFAVGACNVISAITGFSKKLSFAVLRLGDHDFTCGVRHFKDDESYLMMERELLDNFDSGAFANMIRQLDEYFGTARYTLGSLFKDEQRRILNTLTTETTDAFEQAYSTIFEENKLLMGFIGTTDLPVAKAFLTAAEFTLNVRLKRSMTHDAEAANIREIIEEFDRWGLVSDVVDMEFTFRRTLERKMLKLETDPTDTEAMSNLNNLVELALSLPFDLNLWTTQNTYYRIAKEQFSSITHDDTDEHAKWTKAFKTLGEKLNFNLQLILE
jgi:alpha-amylase/alpha-mannosidase (GH57 family)